MKNDYEVRGDITAIIINSPKHGRHEALISTSKLQLVKDFSNSWCIAEGHSTLYVRGQLYVLENASSIKRKQKSVQLHRWITGAPPEIVVDHIDYNGLNNTDDNLRAVTKSENSQNRKGAAVNSVSGIRGVTWHKASNRWSVQLCIKRVKKHIGYFGNIEEAEKAAIAARAKYLPFANG